jgi:hypothetical protein
LQKRKETKNEGYGFGEFPLGFGIKMILLDLLDAGLWSYLSKIKKQESNRCEKRITKVIPSFPLFAIILTVFLDSN